MSFFPIFKDSNPPNPPKAGEKLEVGAVPGMLSEHFFVAKVLGHGGTTAPVGRPPWNAGGGLFSKGIPQNFPETFRFRNFINLPKQVNKFWWVKHSGIN